MSRSFLAISLLFSLVLWSSCGEQTTPSSSTTPPRLKILGGQVVRPSQWKSVVALTDSRGGGRSFCTATLITPQVAITAAHCLESIRFRGSADVLNYLKVYLGSGQEGGDFVGQYGVRAFGVNPLYRLKKEVENDAAYLVLEQPVGADELNDADLIPLYSMPSPRNGTPLTLVGFGNRKILGHAEIESGEEPQTGVKYEVEVKLQSINESTLHWSGNSYPPRGHYFGDSGGPVFVRGQDARWYQIAIISRGQGAKGEGQDVLISSQICWMQKELGELFPTVRKECP